MQSIYPLHFCKRLLPICLPIFLLGACGEESGSTIANLDANTSSTSNAGIDAAVEVQAQAMDAGGDAGLSADAPVACDNGARITPEEAVWPCSTAAVTTMVYTDRALFEAALASKTNTINFDCVPSSGDDVESIPSDAFLFTHGATVAGKGSEAGQYVSRTFTFPSDFAPSSRPNAFAPGPKLAANAPVSKPTTHVAFPRATTDGCVAGFGAVFIDVDFASQAVSSLTIANQTGDVVSMVVLPNAPSGRGQFRGVITFDANGSPTPAIAGADMVTGNVFATQPVGEGVVLDDFVFGSVDD
ncbi:MAG: hypothetical protein SGJ11_03915 [Phycisphaerae bacterium]|nr:hypothetical protein [Phycisphaerae bacterium]